MILTNNNKLFRIRFLNETEPRKQIFNLASLRGRYGMDRIDLEIIEYDVVEVGRIKYNDLHTRFPTKKKR
jgi:hypothetical protein